MFRQLQSLPWVNDGLSEVETGVIEQLLYMGVDDIGDLTAVLDLDWLRESPETADSPALRAMRRLGRASYLSLLLAHPSAQDGIDDEEAVLVAAAGTMKDSYEIGRLLDPDYASVETVAIPTERTPTLQVSVVRTETQTVTGTVELVADAVGFVENLMQRALPIDHMIVVLHEKATVQDYAGTNFGFAISYLPHYEQAKNTPSWQVLPSQLKSNSTPFNSPHHTGLDVGSGRVIVP